MKQENKELLLRDLCSRLPYGVMAEYYDAEEECKCDADIDYIDISASARPEVGISQYVLPIEEVKPYLFPMSSMTDIQKEIYKTYKQSLKDEKYFIENFTSLQYWLYANHFDVNKLIEKGLAIDATGLNIY